MEKMLKRYLIYILRWQLSTPILAVVLILLASFNKWTATVIANFIGALIFFWVDRAIFTWRGRRPLWEIEPEVACADCGATGRGYRVVKSAKYDRLNDPRPQFRCAACAERKLNDLRERGVAV
jgi:hypothetical protein